MHGWQTSVQRLIPHPQPQQARGESFYRQSWAEGWCPSRNSIVVSNSHLQIIISGLISIILIVLGTVNLQFQGSFVSISLRSILRIVAAHGYSLLIMLTSPLGVLVFIRPLTGYGSEYYLCVVLC